MEAVRCGKGHYYDKQTHSECPICADMARKEHPAFGAFIQPPGHKYVTCANGHRYNATMNPQCPFCAEETVVEDYPETIPVTPEPEIGGIAKCEVGHFYDRSLASCPVCAMFRKPVEVTLEEKKPAPERKESRFIKCSAGHSYDKSLEFCPICAAADNTVEEFPETEAADPETVAGGIMKCSAGHYFLRSQGKCPICATMTDEIEVTEPVQNIVSCGKGHFYDKNVNSRCPICAETEKEATQETDKEPKKQPKKNPQVRFADTEPSDDLLLFTAYQNLSYRIFRENGQMRLQVRTLISGIDLILENTVNISMADAMGAARKILNALTEDGQPAFLRNPSSPDGDSRLLFNTRQLNCDYRWTEPFSMSASWEEMYMRSIHEILGEFYAQATQGQGSSEENNENLCACLDAWNIDLHLSRENGAYTLVVETLIYYQFTNSFTLRDTVSLPLEAGEKILSWLADSGVMEAMIGKNKRPGDGICRDPAMATVFYLKTGGLTYDYRDWDKINEGKESTVLHQAQDKLLEWFKEYRNNV